MNTRSALKLVFMIVLVLGSGCASTAKKESLQSIFEAIKGHRFAEAEKIYQGNAGSDYQSFTGDTLESDHSAHSARANVRKLMDEAMGSITKCESFISKVKAINPHSASADDHPTEDYRKVREDYRMNCISYVESPYAVVKKVKSYANVNFVPLFDQLHSKFEQEVARIEGSVELQNKAQQKNQLETEENEKAYRSSPKFYEDKICEFQKLIEVANKNIRNENEIGSKSGFVNKEKLYKSGQAVQGYSAAMKRAKNEFKVKFGREMNSGHCR